MKRMLALAFLLVAAPAAGALPGARSVATCAAAGDYWPTMTLAFRGTTAWVACKEQSRLVRVNPVTGSTLKTVRLRGPAIAVASGFGSLWALDSYGTLYRVTDAGKVTRRVATGALAAYNIWIGGGSVWVADDRGARVLRISPATGKVVARVRVGDGPASMAFSSGAAWVMNHRDRVLTRIDLARNTPHAVGVIGSADQAPERVAFAHGRLWVTGRGVDLLQVDPATARVERTIEIGGSGIDLVVAGDDVWVPARSAEVDRTGFPTMDALVRVSMTTGEAKIVARPTARVDVHGIAYARGALWLADNTGGVLYEVG